VPLSSLKSPTNGGIACDCDAIKLYHDLPSAVSFWLVSSRGNGPVESHFEGPIFKKLIIPWEIQGTVEGYDEIYRI